VEMVGGIDEFRRGKLVNDQEFYRNAKLTLQKLDQATEGLEDQGPLSVLGLAVSKLF
jgi:phospholipid/cholesterol/gamma-HCH transport system substrate-binding protein